MLEIELIKLLFVKFILVFICETELIKLLLILLKPLTKLLYVKLILLLN